METYAKIGVGIGVGIGVIAFCLWLKKREDEIAKIHYSIGVKDNNNARVKLEQKLTEKYNLKEEEVKKLSNALERSEKAYKSLLHALLLLKETNNLNKTITEKELLELIDAPINPGFEVMIRTEMMKVKSKNAAFSPKDFEINWVKKAILSNA